MWQGGDCFYKIGVSANPVDRRRGLSSLFRVDIEEVCVYESQSARALERAWHKRFSDKKIKVGDGLPTAGANEWFKLDHGDVAAFLKEHPTAKESDTFPEFAAIERAISEARHWDAFEIASDWLRKSKALYPSKAHLRCIELSITALSSLKALPEREVIKEALIEFEGKPGLAANKLRITSSLLYIKVTRQYPELASLYPKRKPRGNTRQK